MLIVCGLWELMMISLIRMTVGLGAEKDITATGEVS